MSLNHLKYYKGNSSFRYLIFLAHYGMLQLLIKVLEKISGTLQEKELNYLVWWKNKKLMIIQILYVFPTMIVCVELLLFCLLITNN